MTNRHGAQRADRPSRPASASTPRRTARMAEYDEKKTEARQLFLMGMSYRDIAQRVGLGENGYVTIARWADKLGWKAERETLEQENKAAKRQTYLNRVSTIQDAHLRLAERVRLIAGLALEGYIETNDLGDITGVKINQRTGLPAISPYAIQQLITAAADLERKALGVELLPTEDMEQLSSPTIDATPLGEEQQAMLRRMGDWLAQQTLIEPTVADDDSMSQRQNAGADALQERPAPEGAPVP